MFLNSMDWPVVCNCGMQFLIILAYFLLQRLKSFAYIGSLGAILTPLFILTVFYS